MPGPPRDVLTIQEVDGSLTVTIKSVTSLKFTCKITRKPLPELLQQFESDIQHSTWLTRDPLSSQALVRRMKRQ